MAVARSQGGAAETTCLEGRAERWRGAQVDVGGRGGAQGSAAALEGDRRAVDGGNAEGRR